MSTLFIIVLCTLLVFLMFLVFIQNTVKHLSFIFNSYSSFFRFLYKIERIESRLFGKTENEFKRNSLISSYVEGELMKMKYYKSLDLKNKSSFNSLMKEFEKDTYFVFDSDFKNKNKAVILYCASAAILFNGFKKSKLPIVKRVVFFEHEFFNRRLNQKHKGEFSIGGQMSLSFKDVKFGFEDENDNLNLTIHELAHALCLQYRTNWHQLDTKFCYYFSIWNEMMDNKYIRQSISNSNYFREYGKTNLMELFAVSTECFFETPKLFKSELPQIYSIFVKLYNIDTVELYAQQ